MTTCDTLQGRYPKDFKWTGWHPFCRCFATAITASEKERDKYWDAMADGEDFARNIPAKIMDAYYDRDLDKVVVEMEF